MPHKLIRMIVAIAMLGGALAAFGPSATAAGRNLFARVAQDGSLITGSGVSSVTHLSTGRYEVTFTRNVSRCAYVATTRNAHSQALTVFTAGGHASPQGVYVETKNQGGGLTDGPFDLVVSCGRSGMRFAVVGYSADLVRATPGTTLTNLGSGRYILTFASRIQRCAYIATVGDPGSELVFAPAGVYTASGEGPRSVYVETKNPGGGLSDGIPFHLAVMCSSSSVRNAVVGADGIPTRASALTSSYRFATGRYTVVTNRALDSCATVATRGSTDTSVPFTPATVELSQGPAPNAIGIEVRNLLFFGGDFLDESFHSAIVC